MRRSGSVGRVSHFACMSKGDPRHVAVVRARALYLPCDREWRKTAGLQTTIQQALIDSNVVDQQLAKAAPKAQC